MIAKEKWKHLTPLKDFAMVEVICRILEGVLTKKNCPPGSEKDVYEAYFQFAAVWAFGGAFGADKGADFRKQFDSYWRSEFSKSTLRFPDDGLVFDYFIDPDQEGRAAIGASTGARSSRLHARTTAPSRTRRSSCRRWTRRASLYLIA